MFDKLIAAVKEGNEDVVKWLVEQGVAIDQEDEIGDTPLMIAVDDGIAIEIIEFLLEKGADINRRTGASGKTVLMLALGNHNFDIAVVTLLLEKGAKVNQVNKSGENELMVAVGNCNSIDILELLLENGVDIKHIDNNGVTILIKAVELCTEFFKEYEDYEAIIGFLLDKGVAVDQQDNGGSTALTIAAVKGAVSIMKTLLEWGAKVDLSDKNGRTALMEATLAEDNVVDSLKLLLERGADITLRDKWGETALTMVLNKDREAAELIIQHAVRSGLRIDVEKQINDCQELEQSCKELFIQYCKACQEAPNPACEVKNAPIEACYSNSGINKIDHVASDSVNNQASIETVAAAPLSDNEANPNIQVVSDKDNSHAASIALSPESKDRIFNRLLEAVKQGPRSFQDPGYSVEYLEYLKYLKYLLENGADVKRQDEFGNTLLMIALRKGIDVDVFTLNFLLDNGVDVNQKNNLGSTPLMMAVTRCSEAIIRLLFNRGADVKQRDKFGNTVLTIALEKGTNVDLSTINFLLDNGVDVNQKDNLGNTALMTAAAKCSKNIVRLLLSRGADVNAVNNSGYTALMMVAFRGKLDSAKFLLEEGADIDLVNDNGNTAWTIALKENHIDLAKLIIKFIPTSDLKNKVKEQINNSQWLGQIGKEELIQHCKFEEDARDYADNKTFYELIKVVKNSYIDVLEYLINKGANVNQKDKFGNTLLMIALRNGSKSAIANFLLEEGVDVNQRNDCGDTALVIALREGIDVATIDRLLENGAEVNQRNKCGDTPLMIALKKGIDDNQKNNYDISTMGVASYSKAVLELLLNRGANVNLKNNSGDTVLMMAALKGDMDSIKLFLKKGAEINLMNEYAETALTIAGRENYRELAKFIIMTILAKGLKNNIKEQIVNCQSMEQDCKEELIQHYKTYEEVLSLAREVRNILIEAAHFNGGVNSVIPAVAASHSESAANPIIQNMSAAFGEAVGTAPLPEPQVGSATYPGSNLSHTI